jgi:hypothetical protein
MGKLGPSDEDLVSKERPRSAVSLSRAPLINNRSSRPLPGFLDQLVSGSTRRGQWRFS